MKKQVVVFIVLMLCMASWVQADFSENSLVPKNEMNFAKNYLADLRARNFESVLRDLDPELSRQVSMEQLEEVAAYFPEGKLLTTELIGSQVNTFEGVWQGNFSFEYEFESGWAVANVVMQRAADQTMVTGFNVYKTDASQKSLNKFELADKSALHYIFLTLACVVPLFIIISLIYCIKTPIPKRKWLWVLFMLGGIGTASINWSTGEFWFHIFQYQILGASALASSEYSPWVISVGFPLGSILFWLKRKSFITSSTAGDAFARGAANADDAS